MGIDPKAVILKSLFGRWGRTATIGAGYTILIPCPADMPFLLQFALEGLSYLDLEDCSQVIVVGDGFADDSSLRRVVERSADPRVEMATVGPLADFFVHKMGRCGGGVANWTHWAMIVEGTRRARGEFVLLHDVDAFFLEAGTLQRQHRECLDRGMVALGVQARSDLFFSELGRTIPGTWELMFSTRWARHHAPIDFKGRRRETPFGVREFDTMLYPLFTEGPGGTVGVLDPPPRFVHFAGAITAYRTSRDSAGAPVVDELFRLLLLSLLEDLVPAGATPRATRPIDELARGLSDPGAPVSYASPVAVQEYPIFRGMVSDLCDLPMIGSERAIRIVELLRPFDEHFAVHKEDPTLGSLAGRRRVGLG